MQRADAGAGIDELDTVMLTADLPAVGLRAGALGTVVLVHDGGRGFEVELLDGAGETLFVTTVMADDVHRQSDQESGPGDEGIYR